MKIEKPKEVTWFIAFDKGQKNIVNGEIAVDQVMETAKEFVESFTSYDEYAKRCKELKIELEPIEEDE